MESSTSSATGVTKGAGERIKYKIKGWKTVWERRRKTVVKWSLKEEGKEEGGGKGKEKERRPCYQNSCVWCPLEVLVALVTHHCTTASDTWSIADTLLSDFLQSKKAKDKWETNNALI